jgi:multisubunit Na+/H+ antiporter MnhF subunit
MTLFWIFLALAVLLMVGNALTLLRTAKRPKLPEGVKPQPYRDDEEN